MSVLIKNIKALLQVRDNPPAFIAGKAMSELPMIEDAFLLIENDTIVDYGKMIDGKGLSADLEIDARNRFVLPCWCDSHSHIVYAGNREQEFVDRINGLSYEDIAARGGGILNSAKTLNQTDAEALYEQSLPRVQEIIQQGTGAVEIKSGYGLSVDGEMKMLGVIKRIRKEFPIEVVPTFLGAHALPEAFSDNKSGYVDLIINEMLPRIADKRLARYIDVFCEKGYFDLKDTERIIRAGLEYGLKAKVHVNQFNAFGGVEVCTRNKALSVDHLEVMNPEDIDALKKSDTMPVALPGCSFFLGIPYTPARQLIDAGLPLAIATDFNPGSAPSGNMNFMLSLACIKMGLTPEEAINAATLNGAYAMGIQNRFGSVSRGKKANVIISKPIESYNALPYHFGSNLIENVLINGEVIKKPQGYS